MRAHVNYITFFIAAATAIVSISPIMVHLYNTVINPVSWADTTFNGPYTRNEVRYVVEVTDISDFSAKVCNKPFISLNYITVNVFRKSDGEQVDRRQFINEDESLACHTYTIEYPGKTFKPNEYVISLTGQITNNIFHGQFILKPKLIKFVVEK